MVLKNVEMWSETDGLMEDSYHEILFFNTVGNLADNFLSGRTDRLDFDDTLSCNSSFDWFCDSGVKKLKQCIRLSRYYNRIKRELSSTFKPKEKILLLYTQLL